jgi:hypothetical protein
MMVTWSPPIEIDHGFLGMEVPAGQLELLGDPHHPLHPGQGLEEFVERRWHGRTNHAHNCPLLAAAQVNLEPQFLDPVRDHRDFLTRCMRVHHDNHGALP